MKRPFVVSGCGLRRFGLRWFALLAVVAAWLVPGVASAHPLGNFTVNHYARIEPSSVRVRVFYVLDMAEIPTYQEQPKFLADQSAYADERAESIRRNLHLTVDGRPIDLQLDSRAISFPGGAGGLSTLRLESWFSARVAGSDSAVDLAFRDDNDPTRIGWREIVARPGEAAAQIQRSSVPADDVTHELRQYPEDLLNSPLNVRSAQLTVSLPGPGSSTSSALSPNSESASLTSSAAGSSGSAPGVALALPSTSGNGIFDRTRSAFAELANGSELTPAFIIFVVGVAIILGAAHALQPGHGKTVVAAYLVGSRGTAKHAMFLGATVTVTHTAGVYALGLVTLFLSQYIVPERLYPILEVVSGGLVIGIGIWLLAQRLLVALGLRQAADHHHDHGHTHPDHNHGDHERAHDHADVHGVAHHNHYYVPSGGNAVTWRSLLALGVSGGLLPCPEALMVLLITIAAHRVLFGLLLIVAFSTGLAAVLVAFGLLLVYAKGLFGTLNLSKSGLVPRVLPVVSAGVIVVAGGVITSQALPQVL